MEGAKYVCSRRLAMRPARRRSGKACSRACSDFPLITARSIRKQRRQAYAERQDVVRWVPNGIPGVETRLPILFPKDFRQEISLNRFVS